MCIRDRTEAGRGGAAQSTALAAQSAPEGAKKRTPATGVSAQQNAAWQAAGQGGAGQAPVFSLTASSRAHAPQRENDAQPSLPAPGLQPWDFEQELQRTQASIQALIQGAREEGQARQEQREQQQAAQQTNKAPLSDVYKRQVKGRALAREGCLSLCFHCTIETAAVKGKCARRLRAQKLPGGPVF